MHTHSAQWQGAVAEDQAWSPLMMRDVGQIGAWNCRDSEAALLIGPEQTFLAQSVQCFAQRAAGTPITALQLFEFRFGAAVPGR